MSERRVQKITPEGREWFSTELPGEEPLTVEVNGHTVAIIMRSPGHEKELAVGFCLSEGIIDSFRDILLVHHCGLADPFEEPGVAMESRNLVRIRARDGAVRPEALSSSPRWIQAGCGPTRLTSDDPDLSTLDGELKVTASTLRKAGQEMRRSQPMCRAAGGSHAAAIFDAAGDLIALQEDVGRHNAVDKAAGYCQMRGIDLSDKFVASSGRASYDMVSKAVHLGLSIVVTFSSPTSLAVELAELYRCTVVGYLRGRRMNAYSHPWRIVGDEAGP